MESKSYSELAKKLGYSYTSGGAIRSIKNAIKEYNIDTSHFLGKKTNSENYDYSSFENGSNKKNGKTLLFPLIKLRGRKCENCGITEWLGKPVNLEVHHKDGKHNNNELNNLQILCPNCHSMTSNYKRRKTKQSIKEEYFVYALQNNKSIHSALIFLGLSPVGGNYIRARELIEKYNIKHLQH